MVYLVAGCIGGLEGIKQNINLLNIKYLYSIMTTEIQAIDFDTALKRIVQTSNSDSLLAKGIHEVSKSLESKDEKVKARYVILAKNCTEANYVKIIKGLAAQNKVTFTLSRSLSMRSKPERPLENGWESANLTRTETSPKREKSRRLPLETSPTMSRKKRRKYSSPRCSLDCLIAL